MLWGLFGMYSSAAFRETFLNSQTLMLYYLGAGWCMKFFQFSFKLPSNATINKKRETIRCTRLIKKLLINSQQDLINASFKTLFSVTSAAAQNCCLHLAPLKLYEIMCNLMWTKNVYINACRKHEEHKEQIK